MSETPADVAPADVATADEATADVAPADEATADEAPADEATADVAPAGEAAADVAPGRSVGLTDAEALARLPRAYRSWVPGVARVAAALMLTVAGGLVLRSVPDPAIGTAAAATSHQARTNGVVGQGPGGAALTSMPVALSRARVTAEIAATPGAVVTSRITGRPERPVDLHVLMTSPAGVRVVAATRSIPLHVDVSDGQGGDVAGVDLVWQVRSGSTAAVVFRGHGADVELPVGLLGEGNYHVTVRAFAGVTETTDAGLLVVTAGRA